jgi:hypothetical protein
MVDLFSSPSATAIANVLVFVGIVLTTFRVLRSWTASVLPKFRGHLRRNQQKELVADLRRLRIFRTDPLLLASHIVKAIISELTGYAMFITVIIVTTFFFINFQAVYPLGHPKQEVSEIVIRDPLFWSGIAFITFAFSAAVTILWTLGLQYAVRDIKRTAEFDEERRKVLMRYLDLRRAR